MQRLLCCTLVVASLGVNARPANAAVGQAVADYHPGTGFAVEFGTGLGYTNTQAALGRPNPQTSFGPVTPFNPPFEREEILSIGEGGHAVFELDASIWNNPDHPFGIDFIIYGSAGFIDVAFPDGMTDESASLFGQNTGETRVWVSPDNVDFFMLDPLLAPTVDGLFPTDSAGQWGMAVDPSLTQQDFAGRSIDQIRDLYAGAAGGTGFDLAWALDAEGDPVQPDEVRYIRVEVLSGRSEIDAVMGVTVVPEPSPLLLGGMTLAGLWIRRLRRRGWAVS